MTSNGYTPFEIRVPLQKKCVDAVHFRGHGVHDRLAVGGAVVEENVQDRVVGEVPQPVDAGQGYPLQIPEGEEATGQQARPLAALPASPTG